MVKLAVKDGKFIIKDGKIAVVQDEQSSCSCCCKQCCWKIDSLTGCPGPEVDADLEGNSFTFRFMDSENCREVGDPQNCKPNPNKDTDTTDKTTCNQLQYIILTNEWTITETTNLTVDLSGTAETSAPDKDYIDITITPLTGQPIVGDGGDQRFRPGNTYHARIASDDGNLGSSEDGCNMNDISGSWTFELAPGCWGVKVYSCTRDAFSHIGMTNTVKFSFDTEKPANCKDHLCTSAICGDIISNGIREEKNPRNGSDYGFAIIDKPITKCNIEPWEEEGEPPSISDCIKNCESGNPNNPCKRIEYYCCVDGVCNRFSKKLCGNELTKSSDEKSGVDGEADVGGGDWGVGANFCSADGPYYCTLQQCVASKECKVKYCCDDKDETCRPCNKVIKSSDEKNGVDGTGFDTIEECRQVCEAGAKYNCDTGISGESAQCVKAKDPNNAQYENIDDCITDCEENKGSRFTCTEAGECLRNAFGEYDNIDQCLLDCGNIDPNKPKWYCCYDSPPPKAPAKDTRKTICTPEEIPPKLDQNGNVLPVCEHGAASGPHSAKACSIICGSHDCVRRCDGSKVCIKKDDGPYLLLSECLSKCRAAGGPKPPCELTQIETIVLDVENDDPDDPRLDKEIRWFTTDEYERQICVAYSTDGKPIKIQFYRVVCDANSNIVSIRLAYSSPWFGEKDCDCEGRKAVGGKFENRLNGEVKWKKFRGLGVFGIKILSCDAESYEIDVQCDECCDDDPARKCPDVDEANGACCNPQGANNVDWPEDWGEICEENVSKGLCEAVGGKFLGPCSKCTDEDGNDNCNVQKGACCIEDQDKIRQCLDRKTKKVCENTFNGTYQGDNTWCDEPINRENPNIPKDNLILCPGQGACCVLEWEPITINDCSVVDYISANGKKASDIGTIDCEGGGECSKINIDVEYKTIKCIDATEENKKLLLDKIDSAEVLVSITLPQNNCDGSTVEKQENKTEIIPLETYPYSYDPLFTINTKNVKFGNNIKFTTLSAKNGGKVGDIAVIKQNNIVQSVLRAVGYSCSHTNQDNCDNKEGIFTENENCCKKFGPNNVDCEEQRCSGNIKAAGVSTASSYKINSYQQPSTVLNTASGGPGTELKKLLSKIGINPTPTCSCNSRARIMDEWGTDICEQEIGTILEWLREEATKRKLPFIDMAGYILIKRAIYNARKNNK